MTYEFRTADGATCCSTNNLEHLCAACKSAATQYDAPNAYAPALAALRAASTPTFEEKFKAERLAALATEYEQEAR